MAGFHKIEIISIDDWGIKFLQDKKVLLYSLDKFIYEIYQYSRTYRTDLRYIMILKGIDVEENKLVLAEGFKVRTQKKF